MKFKSTIFAQTSGSLAGTVFSHNKGGMYVRNRSTPVNPATVFQQSVRNAVKQLTTRWSQTLTPAQRAEWKTYAVNVPLLNKLGESRVIPELAMYVRCNTPRLISGGAPEIVDNGPSTFSLATFTQPTVAYVSPNLTVIFDNTNDWAIHTGGRLYVYQSRPQNVSINFFKGPYRLVGEVDGDTTTPPTSPASLLPAFPVLTGHRYFFQFRASDTDGRLSSAQQYQIDF